MKKFVFILIVCLMFLGCGNDCSKNEEPDWKIAPKVYKCTKEQMERVEHETKWCDDNTDYFRSYCYGTAFIRNCTKEVKDK